MHVGQRATLATLALGVLALSPVSPALAGNGDRKAPPACPGFSAANFHTPTTIDNAYFPLMPGTRFTYRGTAKRAAVVDTVTVTRTKAAIDGVQTIQVRDQVIEDGVLAEDTLDWYAQDDQHNVWYFGELATQLPAGTHDGSWTAGVGGAQPGYIMEAEPKVGDIYCQENAPGVAQDVAEVLSVSASRSVPYRSFSGNALQTKDYSLLETKNENKFYGPGVGLLEAVSVSGPSEDIQLASVTR